jgi:hypothetical protein
VLIPAAPQRRQWRNDPPGAKHPGALNRKQTPRARIPTPPLYPMLYLRVLGSHVAGWENMPQGVFITAVRELSISKSAMAHGCR